MCPLVVVLVLVLVVVLVLGFSSGARCWILDTGCLHSSSNLVRMLDAGWQMPNGRSWILDRGALGALGDCFSDQYPESSIQYPRFF